MLSNSQLLTTKIKEISCNDTTTKELMEYVKTACEKRHLDLEKVAEELVNSLERTVEIRNVSAFVRAIVIRLDDKKFKKHVLKPSFDSLTKAFNQYGIVGETWELFLIHSIEEHCLNEFHIKLEDLVATNQAIVNYCKVKNIKKLSTFKDLLLKSRALKDCNVPIVVLEKQAKEYGESYEKIMKDLEEDEDLYGKSEDNGTLC